MMDSSNRGRDRVQTVFDPDDPDAVSQTIQSQGRMSDITEILKQYSQVGIIENLNQAEAMFMDISEFTDYADAMRYAKEAEFEFMKLPSKVRAIFHHDVGEWLDTAHDEEKRDALVEAGVIDGPKSPGGGVVEEVGPAVEKPAEAAGAAEVGGEAVS